MFDLLTTSHIHQEQPENKIENNKQILKHSVSGRDMTLKIPNINMNIICISHNPNVTFFENWFKLNKTKGSMAKGKI